MSDSSSDSDSRQNMSAYRSVIVGTDGSATAERAVGRAVTVARALGVELTVATAWYRDMPDAPVLSELAEYPAGSAGAMEASWAEYTVGDAAGIARSGGLSEVRTATPQGGPADGLLELVEDQPDALLVVGTVGLGSRAERLIGNVPHQITHHSPADVLLVRSTEHPPADYERVALATDGSKTACLAVARGLELARALGAATTLLTVARDEDDGEQALDRTIEAVDGADELERRVFVSRQIGAGLTATAPDYDILVIGNKGMSGPSRLLGSVANEVTHRVPTDILLVNTTRKR